MSIIASSPRIPSPTSNTFRTQESFYSNQYLSYSDLSKPDWRPYNSLWSLRGGSMPQRRPTARTRCPIPPCPAQGDFIGSCRTYVYHWTLHLITLVFQIRDKSFTTSYLPPNVSWLWIWPFDTERTLTKPALGTNDPCSPNYCRSVKFTPSTSQP